jgi:hypothetical protein
LICTGQSRLLISCQREKSVLADKPLAVIVKVAHWSPAKTLTSLFTLLTVLDVVDFNQIEQMEHLDKKALSSRMLMIILFFYNYIISENIKQNQT